MEQNTIAVIWDFDKTLIPGYMQDPIFEEYGIDGKEFWNEVNKLADMYKEQGICVNKDTIYLNHIITCAKQGIFPNLNNQKLRELGKKLTFYKGIPGIFEAMNKVVIDNMEYKKFSIGVEHYIVSTGLTEMIRGSIINDYVEGIWGCEFIEKPIRSNLRIRINETDNKVDDRIVEQIGYIIDNTSKTRAIFEINKGSNKFEIDVNSKIDKSARRVPIENMIYIADGPSDVPVFSVVRQYGGRTFAIYPKGDVALFRQVNELIKDDRINMYAEADYSEGTTAYIWLTESVRDIAESIYESNMNKIKNSAGKVPTHYV